MLHEEGATARQEAGGRRQRRHFVDVAMYFGQSSVIGSLQYANCTAHQVSALQALSDGVLSSRWSGAGCPGNRIEYTRYCGLLKKRQRQPQALQVSLQRCHAAARADPSIYELIQGSEIGDHLVCNRIALCRAQQLPPSAQRPAKAP